MLKSKAPLRLAKPDHNTPSRRTSTACAISIKLKHALRKVKMTRRCAPALWRNKQLWLRALMVSRVIYAVVQVRRHVGLVRVCVVGALLSLLFGTFRRAGRILSSSIDPLCVCRPGTLSHAACWNTAIAKPDGFSSSQASAGTPCSLMASHARDVL